MSEPAGTGHGDRKPTTGADPDGRKPGGQQPRDETPAEKASGDTGRSGDRGAGGGKPAGDAPAAGSGRDRALDEEITIVPGIARYHRSGCILIRFMGSDDLEHTTRRAAEAAGCVPCRACQPDQPLAGD